MQLYEANLNTQSAIGTLWSEYFLGRFPYSLRWTDFVGIVATWIIIIIKITVICSMWIM
jgi:hypothetical protein